MKSMVFPTSHFRAKSLPVGALHVHFSLAHAQSLAAYVGPLAPALGQLTRAYNDGRADAWHVDPLGEVGSQLVARQRRVELQVRVQHVQGTGVGGFVSRAAGCGTGGLRGFAHNGFCGFVDQDGWRFQHHRGSWTGLATEAERMSAAEDRTALLPSFIGLRSRFRRFDLVGDRTEDGKEDDFGGSPGRVSQLA